MIRILVFGILNLLRMFKQIKYVVGGFW